MKFFDNVMRFDIETKKMLMFSNFSQHTSDFFKMGRLATAIDNANDEIIVLFGGLDIASNSKNDALII